MFKLINKIQFSKESNRMKEIANTVIARKLYQETKSKNLKFLLKERFGWMNNFINNSDNGIEVGSGAGFLKDYIYNKNLKLTD